MISCIRQYQHTGMFVLKWISGVTSCRIYSRPKRRQRLEEWKLIPHPDGIAQIPFNKQKKITKNWKNKRHLSLNNSIKPFFDLSAWTRSPWHCIHPLTPHCFGVWQNIIKNVHFLKDNMCLLGEHSPISRLLGLLNQRYYSRCWHKIELKITEIYSNIFLKKGGNSVLLFF